jgi:hypothetical protein
MGDAMSTNSNAGTDVSILIVRGQTSVYLFCPVAALYGREAQGCRRPWWQLSLVHELQITNCIIIDCTPITCNLPIGMHIITTNTVSDLWVLSCSYFYSSGFQHDIRFRH